MTKTTQKNRRHRKLIRPRLQIGISATFTGIALVAMLLQALLFASAMIENAEGMPAGGNYILDLIPDTVLSVLFFSLGIILPITVAVGVLTTFKIAGPIYRFQQYLTSVLKGETTRECRIRKGDSFQDLCELINQATEQLRAANGEAEARSASETQETQHEERQAA